MPSFLKTMRARWVKEEAHSHLGCPRHSTDGRASEGGLLVCWSSGLGLLPALRVL